MKDSNGDLQRKRAVNLQRKRAVNLQRKRAVSRRDASKQSEHLSL